MTRGFTLTLGVIPVPPIDPELLLELELLEELLELLEELLELELEDELLDDELEEPSLSPLPQAVSTTAALLSMSAPTIRWPMRQIFSLNIGFDLRVGICVIFYSLVFLNF